MTPEQQKKYYADNKADAKKKEEKKDYEVFGSRGDAARKGMEEGKSNPMGDTYKKGGKVMKKMKRYDKGGDVYENNAPYKSEDQGLTSLTETMQGQNKNIGDDVRARAMAAMEKGSSEESAPVPKKAAAKLTPKGEKAFTKAETGGGAALMTRKDRSNMPKAEPKVAKKSNYTPDYSVGNAMRSGGKVSSASKRADGIATKGKTRGKMC
jgi:hypothetical protein